MRCIALGSVLLILAAGCSSDRMTTYLRGRSGSPRVQANESMAQRGQCEKTELRAEWIEGHLIGLLIESNSQPLYDPEKVSAAIPAIQRSLAEYGNVRIKRVFADEVTLWSEHWTEGGKISGRFAGIYISGDIPAVAIPAEAYRDR